MLVLSRKADESIVLGKDIEIKVLSIEEDRVKIGITAPLDVEIFRKEIYLEIQEENKKAGRQTIDMNKLKDIFTIHKKD